MIVQIGDKVVCVGDTTSYTTLTGFKRGKEYTVLDRTENNVELESDDKKLFIIPLHTVVTHFSLSSLAPTISEGMLEDEPIESNIRDFQKITQNMCEIFKNKNHDYGNSFEKSLDKFGIVASIVRMNDKLERLESLMQKCGKVKDEPIQDTLFDLANYAIMTIMWKDKYK